MTIEDELDFIEQSIIEKLQKKISTLRIEGFPEKPDSYTLTHPKGAVLISFFGADFSDPFSEEDIIQDEEDLFVLNICVKGLRSKKGAYGYIKTIRKALTGFVIPGCRPMIPRQIRFVSEENGIWTFAFIFKLKRKVTPDYDNEG